MKKIVALAALPLLAVSACGGSSTSSVTKTVTKTVTASPTMDNNDPANQSPTSEDAAAASDDGVTPSDEDTSSQASAGAPLAFGDTFTSGETGRKVTLSTLTPYKPSESAALDDEAPAGSVYRKFKITLDNSSKETFDASEVSLSVTAGERTVSTIVDGDVGDTPYVKVLPGRKLSWTVAYAVKPGEHLTVEVSTWGGTVATWDGTVK